jgi:hypothetical protein
VSPWSTPRPSTGSNRAAAIAQALQRAVHRLVVDRDRRALQRDRGQIAGLERRHGVEGRRERQRPPFLDRHVAHVRRVDRFHSAFAQRIVDRARNQVLGHVVEDLILEALLDDARRRLAGAEAGDPRLPGIVARQTDRSRRRRRPGGFRL